MVEIRKLRRSYELVIPPEMRKELKWKIGDLILIDREGDRIIIKKFDYKK